MKQDRPIISDLRTKFIGIRHVPDTFRGSLIRTFSPRLNFPRLDIDPACQHLSTYTHILTKKDSQNRRFQNTDARRRVYTSWRRCRRSFRHLLLDVTLMVTHCSCFSQRGYPVFFGKQETARLDIVNQKYMHVLSRIA